MRIQQQSLVHKWRAPGTVTALFAALVMAMGFTTSAFAASTVVVRPGDLQGWTDASGGGGSVTIAEDAPAGFGMASLELDTGADNTDRATYDKETDILLSDVNELSYYTKQVTASSAGGDASYYLSVDLDGNGDFDTTFIYEPYWQNDGIADPTPVEPGVWQQWDVDSGLFWSSRSYDGTTLDLVAGAGGPPFYTLEQLQEAFPDAVVQSFGVNVGTYNPDYTIRVDGLSFNGTIYDFEAQLREVQTKDECKNGGWEMLGRADGSSFKNQGQCVAAAVSNDNSRHNR